jgi:hypothetical protein
MCTVDDDVSTVAPLARGNQQAAVVARMALA